MQLFELKERFDPINGKSLGKKPVASGTFICDYTGEVIEDDPGYAPQYHLDVVYNRDCEEVYYYDADKKYFKELGIDYGRIWSIPFVFKVNNDYSDVTKEMVKEWLNAREDSYLEGCRTVEEVMRRCRNRTVKRLLKENKYTKEELGLVEDEDL